MTVTVLAGPQSMIATNSNNTTDSVVKILLKIIIVTGAICSVGGIKLIRL